MSYRYPPKVTVPVGLRTLLEGLSRAVVDCQPESIPQFAAFYFATLLRNRERDEIVDLMFEYNATKVPPVHPSFGAMTTLLSQPASQNNELQAISSDSPEVLPGVQPSAGNDQTSPSVPGAVDQGAGKPCIHSQGILYTLKTFLGLELGSNRASDGSFVAREHLSDHSHQSPLGAATSNASLHPIAAVQAEEVTIFRRESSTDGIDSDAPGLCQCTGSTLFKRVPLSEIDLLSNAVLIKTPSVPCEYMIEVQCDNVPDTIVFHTGTPGGEQGSAEREATANGGADGVTGLQSNTRLDITSRLTPPAATSQVFKGQSTPELVTALVLAEGPESIGAGRAVGVLDPHLDLDTNGCNPYISEMMQDIMNEINLPEELNCMSPNNLPPLETDHESMVKPPVLTSYDIQTPGLMYLPVSSEQETTAPCLVYPPISSPQEGHGATLMLPPVSKAEDVSAPGLVCPLISEETSPKEEKPTFKFMDPFLSMAKKLFSINSKSSTPVLESSNVLTGKDETSTPSSGCSSTDPPLSEETREDSLPCTFLPTPEETMALLFPLISSQEKMRPFSAPFTQVPAAPSPQDADPVASQDEASHHHVDEEGSEPSMAPLTCPHHMGVPQMSFRPQHPQVIHSCSREAISQRPCDTAPIVAMAERQFGRSAVCGSSLGPCPLARPESMGGVPTAVACQGESRTELCCGAGHVRILCPMSGAAAYMPANPTIPLHYVWIRNDDYHGRQAGYSYPAASPVHPQGCGCAPVHVCAPHSGTGHAACSPCHLDRSHSGVQQGAAQHCRHPHEQPFHG